MGDRELMARIADGDQAAFRSLYDQFANRLYRYALVRLRSPAAAEDAVQETFLALWREAGRFTGQSSLSTYLFGICHHKVADQLRRKSLTVDLELAAEISDQTEAPVDDRLVLAEALATLPDDMRNVLVLAFYIGLSYEEIAKSLNIPVGTVKSRIFQARKRLQAWQMGCGSGE